MTNEENRENLFQFIENLLRIEAEEGEVKQQQDKAQTPRSYKHTIYDVFHNLTEDEIAIGKDTGVKIRKRYGGFIDSNGDIIPMKEIIMKDLYAIEEVGRKLVNTDIDNALDYYANGHTVRVKYNDELFVYDHQEGLVIPFEALLHGQWFIELSAWPSMP